MSDSLITDFPFAPDSGVPSPPFGDPPPPHKLDHATMPTAGHSHAKAHPALALQPSPVHLPKALSHHERFLPRAEDAARQLIRSWIENDPKQVNQFDPERMPTGPLVEVASGVLDAMLGDGVKDFGGLLAYFTGAPAGIVAELHECAAGFAPQPSDCGPLLGILEDYDRTRRLDILAHRLKDRLEAGEEPSAILREIVEFETKGRSTSLATMLASRAFDFDSHPQKPIPIFQLCGKPLFTPGNIGNIQAPPKAGKSAVIEAMIAAVFNGNRQGPDTLGFSAENPQGHALIHFDTEQSRYDHDALVRRAVRRARVTRTPDWFISYSLADLDIKDRRQALRHVMDEAHRKYGGIFAVMIDGIGDLSNDPNDSEESFDLVHELHARAIGHVTAICTVLHENPGSVEGKTRGHLGSQLERKAETNLRLAKDKNGITTVWAERARHCYLPREQGPCFAWNDHENMHTSCGTAGEIKNAANREKMQDEAERSFGDMNALRHVDLVTAISETVPLKERASKLRITSWMAEGIIHKDSSGNYRLGPP